MGDFNYPDIDYKNLTVESGDESDAAVFFAKTLDMFLVQNVSKPTRVRERQRASLLDYVFTDEENLVENLANHEPLGKSDHACIIWDLMLTRDVEKEEVEEPRLNYFKGNYSALNSELQSIDWDTFLEDGLDIDQMWKKFSQRLGQLVKKHVPKKSVKQKKKQKSEWITSDTIQMMKNRAEVWKKYQEYPSNVNYDKYKTIRNKVNCMVRRDKAIYQRNLIESFKGNDKLFYGYMRRVQTRPVKVAALKNEKGEFTRTNLEAADVLGNFFHDVYTREKPGLPEKKY